METNSNLDFLPILAAGVLWGTMSPAGKQLALLNTDMLTVAFLRTLLMSAPVAIFLLFRDRSLFRISRRQFLFLVIMSGITISGIYAGFFFSLQYLSVSMTIVIFFSHPLLTAIGSALITKEPPTKYQIIAAALTITGVAVTALKGFSGEEIINIRGLFWCMFSAVAMALYSLMGRLSAKTSFVKQPALFFYIQFFGIFWMLLIKSLTTGWSDLPTLRWEQLIWVLHISLIGSLLGYSLYFIGLRKVTAATASIVSCIEIITAMSLSAIFLHQPPYPGEIIGGIFIILAIIMVSRKKARQTVPLQ